MKEFSRRNFLKGALASTACVAAAGILPSAAPAVAEEKVEGFAVSANYEPPIVEVKGGKLRGIMDAGVYNFRGIQYATAERFQQPQPVPAWEGVKDAQAYGAVCPIPVQATVASDELVWPHRFWIQDDECMNLNVWTKTLDKTAKQPVMVFFHGGGFNNGSSIEAYAYEGRRLAEFGDVVSVTVNHRLNVLGCLDLSAYGEEYKNSANITLADLVAALTWVKENIEAFGGDPDRVMIYGQSGGSSKTCAMYYLPAAEGLFACGAGMSSGGPTDMGAGVSAKAAEILLKNLGLDGTQIDVLKKMPYQELLAAANAALREVGGSWGPTMDNEYYMTEWTEHGKKCPYIIGTVFSEWSGTLHKGTGKNDWTPEEVDANLTAAYGENKDAIVAEFSKLYPDKPVQDVLYYCNRNAPMFGGNKNWCETPNMYAQAGAPIYEYMFSYELPINGGITAFHCAELTFAFHNVLKPECAIATGATVEGCKVQDVMAQAWVNFARTGNPSVDGIEWKPWTPEERNMMVFDVNSRCVPYDDRKLCELMAAK